MKILLFQLFITSINLQIHLNHLIILSFSTLIMNYVNNMSKMYLYAILIITYMILIKYINPI